MEPVGSGFTDEELEALAKETEARGIAWQVQNYLEHLPITRVSVDYVNRNLIYTKEGL